MDVLADARNKGICTAFANLNVRGNGGYMGKIIKFGAKYLWKCSRCLWMNISMDPICGCCGDKLEVSYDNL